MIISVIGSGGREHAICKKISESPQVSKIYCIPGNAGTSEIAENIEININNFDEIKNFLIKSKIDLVVVGPEKPLVNGIVDFLEKEKIKVFGPKKISSKLEGSKIFTKKICKKYNIPTANFAILENIEDAIKFLKSSNFPIVIKVDGLASGKGVYICENSQEANEAVEEIFGGKFGEAKNILIEEFLKGDEMSFFVICDGNNFQKFQTAQDHKRVFEGDKGKNTGGMGAYSPSGLINFDLELQNPSMIHEQEKLEMMNQRLEIAEKAMDVKLFSRKWVYDNIFDMSDEEKIEVYKNIVEDTKQKFRLEQIETEGQDPAEQPVGDEGEDDEEMARSGDWGGSKKDPFSGKETQKDVYDSDTVQKRHRSFGKREFKGKSPLATSKAHTAVAREGILNQLKNRFPKSNNSLLSEENILED